MIQKMLTETPEYKVHSGFSGSAQIVVNTGDTSEFLKTVPNEAFKLIITSPPYNIGKEYEKRKDIRAYLEEQKSVIKELVRVLHPQGSICWQVGNWVDKGEVYPLDIFYYDIFKEHGLKLRNRIIWHFGHGLHASNRFSGRYETMLWFTKSDNYTFNLDKVRVPSKYPGKLNYKGEKKGQPSGNPLGKNPSDFWECLCSDWETLVWDIPNVKSNHPEKTEHPCQFPVELVERCVLALTNEDDYVYDPYGGVGSAVIAAIKNKRGAVMSEKEERYTGIAMKRIDDFFAGRLKTRVLGTPVHQPTGKEKVAQIPEEWRSLQ